MEEGLDETIDEGVLILTINRPERQNALDPPTMRALVSATRSAQGNPAVGAVLLRGAGAHFCSGGDIKRSKEASEREAAGEQPVMTQEDRAAFLRRGAEACRYLHQMAKPTIAMLRGSVAGAGIGLATACDFRIASETMVFTTAFVHVGMSGDYGGSYFLPRLVGNPKALELYMLGQRVKGEEAQRIGLITRLVTDDVLEAEALAFAKNLADGPRIALGHMQRNLNLSPEHGLEEVFDLEAMHMARCAGTDDAREAVAAFFEKRKPVFRGL